MIKMIKNTLVRDHWGQKIEYIRKCLYNHPFVQQKSVLKGRWSVKRGLLRHTHAKSTLFFSLNLKWKAFSNSRKALAAAYTDIFHDCCSKFTRKVVPSLHKPTYMKMALCVQNLVVAGHVRQVVARHRGFPVWSDLRMEFRS